MKDKQLNDKIERALASLDKTERCSPRPFFFTRLEARLQYQQDKWAQLTSFFTRPAIAFSCICMVIVLNLFVVFHELSPQNAISQENAEYTPADEYSLVATSLYDFDK